MTDSFQAAPSPASAGAGYGGYGASSPATTGYSSASAAPGAAADPCAEGTAPGGAVNLANVAGDPTLVQTAGEIAQDPVGSKLVQAAQQSGVQLQVGQLPPGVEGLTLNRTITISPDAASNAPDLVHTLAHELGHAATPNDGDSITEEQVVDQLGQQIQQRVAPGPTFQLDLAGYQGQGLPQDNGILNSLARIGIVTP